MPYSLALSGDTGAGKTTQLGELAIDDYKKTGRVMVLNTADRGRYGSIEHIVEAGVIVVNEMGPKDSPWEWVNAAAEGQDPKGLVPDGKVVGIRAFDSGTAIGEAVMADIAKSPQQVGSAKTQRFRINKDTTIGLNNENHYGLAQIYLLDTIWKSTWLEQKGESVVWTFSTDRKDDATGTPVVGPKLVGHALTPAIPKWFKYHFRLDRVPADGLTPERHILYLQAKQEIAGTGISLSNARYALGAEEPLPPSIEPADVAKAIALIEAGKQSAAKKLREELGL